MAAVQINFTLRTSANVETVHLVGSWDSYRGQLPLSRDKSGKPGSWTGTFRFQQSMMHPGKRYWYYYVINGYHVSHDPAAEHTVEPTTGRKLNILDIPQNAALSRASARHPCRAPFNSTEDIIIGRGISPSRIVHPKPSRPYASRQLREDYEDDLSMRLNHSMDLSDSDSDISSSPPSSSGSSFSSRTGSTSPSSLSSLSDSSHSSSHCNCKRYGITRNGERVKLDCRGLVCGSGGLKLKTGDSGKTTPIETDSSCSSDSDEEYRRFAYNVKR